MHILPDDGGPTPPLGDSNRPRRGRSEDSLPWRIITGPWLAGILLAVGWLPLFVGDVLFQLGFGGPHFGLQFGMGWGFGVTFPVTALALALLVFHLVRAIYRG